MLRDLRTFARYARRLPAFVRSTLSPEDARARIECQLRRREETFLALVEHGVYANPRSVYCRLLAAAGVELGDLRRLVGELGLEDALARLRDAGVYVTLDEFKRRVPVERSGLSIAVDERSFDNPLIAPHYHATTSGSRSRATRVSPRPPSGCGPASPPGRKAWTSRAPSSASAASPTRRRRPGWSPSRGAGQSAITRWGRSAGSASRAGTRPRSTTSTS